MLLFPLKGRCQKRSGGIKGAGFISRGESAGSFLLESDRGLHNEALSPSVPRICEASPALLCPSLDNPLP